MRKLLVVLLMGCMLFTGIGSVLASEIRGDTPGEFWETTGTKYAFLKEFVDEIHQINAIRMKRLDLKMQIIEKKDAILDLYIAPRENGNTEILKEAREVRKQLQTINGEIKELHEQVVTKRKAVKEEFRSGNIEAAREHLNQIITLKNSINDKIESKIQLLNEVIQILSPTK